MSVFIFAFQKQNKRRHVSLYLAFQEQNKTFTLPICGGFTLRKFGGAKLLITRMQRKLLQTWAQIWV